MQGKKSFTPQLFVSVNLLDLVPADNFYRKLLTELDLHFIYKATQKYYGKEGQESIDPVVFFKILLVGYLNNINSDRQLIAFCSDSLSIRLFLGYDVDEQLPWHSTISRTRGLYGEEVFLNLCHVLKKVYTFYINTKIRLQFKYNSKIYLQPPFFCNNFSIYNLPF